MPRTSIRPSTAVAVLMVVAALYCGFEVVTQKMGELSDAEQVLLMVAFLLCGAGGLAVLGSRDGGDAASRIARSIFERC